MKKLSYLLLFVVIAFSSCSKKDGSTELPQPSDNAIIGAVPSTFSQKVLIEEFTGAWCGYCPWGSYYFDKLDSTYPGKVIGTAIHVGDIMEAQELVVGGSTNVLDQMFNQYGYPGGIVNRNDPDPTNIPPNDWAAQVPGLIGQSPKCGLAIDALSINGNSLSLYVHAGFRTDVSGEYRLHVYMVEATVKHSTDPDYAQHNYMSQTGTNPDPTSIFYNMPPTMPDWTHKNVLRKVITPVGEGEVIPAADMKQGKELKIGYTVDLTGFNYSNCFIVAFVDKYATTAQGHRIMNVQKVKVGALQNWD